MSACDESVYQGQNWGQQIACLKKDIELLRVEIKGMARDTSSFSSSLGESKQIFSGLLKTLNDMRKDMYDFTRSTQRQYELAEKIAKSYKKAGLQIGLSVGRSKDFSDSFKGATAQIARFGGEISDVEDIYTNFSEKSGRVRILSPDEVENVFKLGKAANLYGDAAADMYESLEQMGVGYEKAGEYLEGLIKDSQAIGLNSSKVVKVLSDNMKSMQTYSFASGVKGMTQMAKLAVKMRMDVSDMLGMADKFYEPEAAIEAAANLQLLGGDIAKAFGDPFETMYLARNKPEELAKKVGGMVENMMTLNEETGEYEFPAEARMQLKAAGDQLGINIDSMVEMARQSSKLKDIKDRMSMTGAAFSEEEMDSIASIARMEGGEFVVDVKDKDGKLVAKSIDKLTNNDLEMIMQSPKDEQDYMTKMVDNSMTTNELLAAINDTFQKSFIQGIDVYKVLEDGSKETIKATREMAQQSVKTSMVYMRQTIAGEIGSAGANLLEKTDLAMAARIKNMTDFIKKEDLTFDVKQGIITITNATGLNPTNTQNPNTALNPTQLQKAKDWCKNNGSVYNTQTGLCDNGDTPQFASGGIVTKPMKAIVGEGGEPEAIFPLSKLEKFLEREKMGGKVSLEGNPTITLNINSNNPNMDIDSQQKKMIQDSIVDSVLRIFSNGGDVNSMYQSTSGKYPSARKI